MPKSFEFIIPPGKTKPKLSMPTAFVLHTGIKFHFSLPDFHISRLNHLFVCGVSFGIADHAGIRAFDTSAASFLRTSLFLTVNQGNSYTDHFIGDLHGHDRSAKCSISLHDGKLSAQIETHCIVGSQVDCTIKNIGVGKMIPPRLSLAEPNPTKILIALL